MSASGRQSFAVRTVALLLVIAAIGLVAASPLALDLLGGSEEGWARRGAIGETYGAAAALLALFALGGVVYSLVLQARETKANREHASRTVHMELLRMAMDDPAYRECWGPYTSAEDERAQRQYIYVNLMLSYWESRWELGVLTEPHLREAAAHMLKAEPGRRFWADTRTLRVTTSESRRAQRFHQIIDEEYLKTLTPDSPGAA